MVATHGVVDEADAIICVKRPPRATSASRCGSRDAASAERVGAHAIDEEEEDVRRVTRVLRRGGPPAPHDGAEVGAARNRDAAALGAPSRQGLRDDPREVPPRLGPRPSAWRAA